MTIPGSVTSIAKYMFKDCTALSEIVIPEGIKNVFAYAFEGCTALKKVTLPVSICYIGEEIFFGCFPEDIYYGGTLEQWGWVSVAEPNYYLRGIEVHPTCTSGHKNEIVTPAIAPTCDARGQTESAVCAECGVLLRESSTILPLGHCYDLQSGICERCGKKNPDHFPVPFTDIANADWFAQSVMWAYKENITGGTSATTFGPNDSCTRAQVVTFLWAANGKPEPKSMDNPFKDVADHAWYLKPVLWAVEQGITGGVADGKFGPDQTCTRAQIATFLYAAKGKPEVNGFNIFKDVADDAWYAKPIIWAANNSVTGGIGDGKFGPNNTCTRAQVVTFLYKVYG